MYHGYVGRCASQKVNHHVVCAWRQETIVVVHKIIYIAPLTTCKHPCFPSKTNRTTRRQTKEPSLCDTMAMFKIKLVGALSVLSVASVMGQSSCVQLNATDLSSCPCDDATLTFTLEGETSVQANTVSECV